MTKALIEASIEACASAGQLMAVVRECKTVETMEWCMDAYRAYLKNRGADPRVAEGNVRHMLGYGDARLAQCYMKLMAGEQPDDFEWLTETECRELARKAWDAGMRLGVTA